MPPLLQDPQDPTKPKQPVTRTRLGALPKGTGLYDDIPEQSGLYDDIPDEKPSAIARIGKAIKTTFTGEDLAPVPPVSRTEPFDGAPKPPAGPPPFEAPASAGVRGYYERQARATAEGPPGLADVASTAMATTGMSKSGPGNAIAKFYGQFHEAPQAVASAPAEGNMPAAQVTMGKPLHGEATIAKALAESPEGKAELDRLVGSPNLKEAITARFAIMGARGGETAPVGKDGTSKYQAGYVFTPKPPDFSDLAADVMVTSTAGSIPGLRVAAEVGESASLGRFERDPEAGRKISEPLMKQWLYQPFIDETAKNLPLIGKARLRPEPVTGATALGAAAGLGSLVGNFLLSKALTGKQGMGNTGAQNVSADLAQQGAAGIGARTGAAAAFGTRRLGPASGAGTLDEAIMAGRIATTRSASLSPSIQAGAVKALEDIAQKNRVHSSITTKLIENAKAALAARVPLIKDAAIEGARVGAQGAALEGAGEVIEGQRDPMAVGKGMASAALQWGVIGAFTRGLSNEQQFQAGYDAVMQSMGRKPSLRAYVEGSTLRKAGKESQGRVEGQPDAAGRLETQVPSSRIEGTPVTPEPSAPTPKPVEPKVEVEAPRQTATIEQLREVGVGDEELAMFDHEQKMGWPAMPPIEAVRQGVAEDWNISHAETARMLAETLVRASKGTAAAGEQEEAASIMQRYRDVFGAAASKIMAKRAGAIADAIAKGEDQLPYIDFEPEAGAPKAKTPSASTKVEMGTRADAVKREVEATRAKTPAALPKATPASIQAINPKEGPRDFPMGEPANVAEKETKTIVEGIRKGRPGAIDRAAKEMAQRAPKDAVFIPIPDETGSTEGNRALAEAIANLSGGTVRDLLERSEPVESSMELRKAGKPGLTPKQQEASIKKARALEEPLQGKKVVFVDATQSTGATAYGARVALRQPKADLLTFAKAEIPQGERAVQEGAAEHRVGVLERAELKNIGRKHVGLAGAGMPSDSEVKYGTTEQILRWIAKRQESITGGALKSDDLKRAQDDVEFMHAVVDRRYENRYAHLEDVGQLFDELVQTQKEVDKHRAQAGGSSLADKADQRAFEIVERMTQLGIDEEDITAARYDAAAMDKLREKVAPKPEEQDLSWMWETPSPPPLSRPRATPAQEKKSEPESAATKTASEAGGSEPVVEGKRAGVEGSEPAAGARRAPESSAGDVAEERGHEKAAAGERAQEPVENTPEARLPRIESAIERMTREGVRLTPKGKKKLARMQKERDSIKDLLSAEEEEQPRKFSSTQIDLPSEAAAGIKELAAKIPDADLAADGREDSPHITVKFGLHTENVEDVRKVLADQGPITVTLGKTSTFEGVEGGTADAVKVDIDSPELHELNKKVGALPNGDEHPEYIPHATVAYVKPGLGKKYAGDESLVGKKITIDALTFSGKDRTETTIPLTGAKVTFTKAKIVLSRQGVKAVPIEEPAPAEKVSKEAAIQQTLEAEGTPASKGDIAALVTSARELLDADSLPKGARNIRSWAGGVLGRPYESRTWRMDDAYDAIEAAVNDSLENDFSGIIGEKKPRYRLGEKTATYQTGAITAALKKALQKEEAVFGGGTRARSEDMAAHGQFSTPLPLALGAQVALDVRQGEKVLEPSAGTGGLVFALRGKVELYVNEIDPQRAEMLRTTGVKTVTMDALRIPLTGLRVNAAITNPPFGSAALKKYGGFGALPFAASDISQRFFHAAMESVVDGGRIVAIMPANVLEAKASGFRQWLAQNYTPVAYIRSPEGAYATRGAPSVETVMVVVDKMKQDADLADYGDQLNPESWDDWFKAIERFQRGGGGSFARGTGRQSAKDVAPVAGSKPFGTISGETENAPERAVAPERLGAVAPRPVDASGGTGGGERIGGPPEPESRAPARLGRDAELVADEASGKPVETVAGSTPELVSGGVRKRVEPRPGDSEERRGELEAANASPVFTPYALESGLDRAAHPRVVVETRSMAGMPAPPIGAVLQSKLVKAAWGRDGAKGGISDEQVDAVLRGITAWEHGHGLLIADDVGVGKTREAGSLILEALARGAKRILFTTKNENNIADAKKELRLLATGSEDGDFPARFIDVGAHKTVKKGEADLPMPNEPTIYFAQSYNFADYAFALSKVKLDTWIGDEAHEWKNQMATRGIRWRELHDALLGRNVRFAYFTATPAVTLDRLGYLYGLREWQPDGFSDWVEWKLGKKPKPNLAETAANKEAVDEAEAEAVRLGDRMDFGGKKKSKGRGTRGEDVFTIRVTPAETEQIMRELKGQGKYISRDLWRGGVEFAVKEVDMLGDTEAAQKNRDMYDEAAELARDISIASRKFGRMNKEKVNSGLERALIQSYMKQKLFSMRLPDVLAGADAALARGEQVVISIHSVSGDGEMEEGVSDTDAEIPVNERLRVAINKINTDEVKKVGSGDGAEFVNLGEIPEALIAKETLLQRARELPGLPDPVRTIEQHFGADNVAVITGKRNAEQRREAMAEFQRGIRTVALISKAGKIGISLHDVNAKKRWMAIADYEWSADTFKQELGRVDRTGQKSSPRLELFASNLAGERKFAATIAARMASLGATSKGSAESTGTDALDQFDVSDVTALEAMRQTVEEMTDEEKSYFTGSKFLKWEQLGGQQEELRPVQSVDQGGIRDFLLDLMMFPTEVADRVWKKWVAQREALRTGDTIEAMLARRTGRDRGTVTRRTKLSASGDPPLAMIELHLESNENRAVLQGFVTPYMAQIQDARGTDQMGQHRTRRYVHVTTPDGEMVSGMELTPSEAFSVKHSFGKAERQTITPEEAWDDLQAGDKVRINGPDGAAWELHRRGDKRIQIRGATIAKHRDVLQGYAHYEQVGNFLFVPDNQDRFNKFVKRFPIAMKGGEPPLRVGEKRKPYRPAVLPEHVTKQVEKRFKKIKDFENHFAGFATFKRSEFNELATSIDVIRQRLVTEKDEEIRKALQADLNGMMPRYLELLNSLPTIRGPVSEGRKPNKEYVGDEAEIAFIDGDHEREAKAIATKAWLDLPFTPTERARLVSSAVRNEKAQGQLDLLDRLVLRPEHVASLVAPLRSPRVERMHLVVTDEAGYIKSHIVISSGALNYVGISVRQMQQLADRVKRAGGTRVILVHNHPSGDPAASEDDRTFTAEAGSFLQKQGIYLTGHMVIDHDTFTWMQPDENGDIVEREGKYKPAAGVQDWTKLGPEVTSPRELFKTMIASGVHDPDGVTVIWATSNGHMLAIEPKGAHVVENIDTWLQQRARELGADAYVIGGPKTAPAILKKVGKRNPHVVDILEYDEDQHGAQGISYKAHGLYDGRIPYVEATRRLGERPPVSRGGAAKPDDESRRGIGPAERAERLPEPHRVAALLADIKKLGLAHDLLREHPEATAPVARLGKPSVNPEMLKGGVRQIVIPFDFRAWQSAVLSLQNVEPTRQAALVRQWNDAIIRKDGASLLGFLKDHGVQIVSVNREVKVGEKEPEYEASVREPAETAYRVSAPPPKYLSFGERKGYEPLVQSSYEEIEKRWRGAHGARAKGLKPRFLKALDELKRLTRHYPDIDPSAGIDQASAQETLLELERAPKWASTVAYDRISNVTDGLTLPQVDLFERALILPDIIKDVDAGLYDAKEMPFGYKTRSAIEKDLERYQAEVEKQPAVKAALAKRAQFVKRLTEELVDAELLGEDVLKDDRYYHRQVMAYLNADEDRAFVGAGAGRQVRLRRRGFQRHRIGGSDFNTRYVEAEFEWVAQALSELKTKATLEKLEQQFDRVEQLKKLAKQNNADLLVQRLAAEAGITDPMEIAMEGPFLVNKATQSFRQSIAVGRQKLLEALVAEEGGPDLSALPDSLARYADELREAYAEWKAEQGELEKADRTPFANQDRRWFALLSELVKQGGAAGIASAQIFKAIRGRETFIREKIGEGYINPKPVSREDYEALLELAPEGYVTWQPVEGNYFHKAMGLNENIFLAVLNGDRQLSPSDRREILALGGAKETWIIPEWLAPTLSEFGTPKMRHMPTTAMGKFFRALGGLWKQNVLMNPTRIFKYNFNNLSGDVDAAVAYSPKIFKQIPRAARDLRKYVWQRESLNSSERKALESRMQRAVELGVIDAGISAVEIPDVMELPAFQRLAEMDPASFMKNSLTVALGGAGAGIGAVSGGIPGAIVGAATGAAIGRGHYFEWARRLTQFRENILRLAAFQYFEDRIASGGGTGLYAASNHQSADALRDKPDRLAALLARDLIGDYQAVSGFTQAARGWALPFFSFQEVNFKRYMRLVANTLREGQAEIAAAGGNGGKPPNRLGQAAAAGDAAGRLGLIGGVVGKRSLVAIAKRAFLVNMFFILAALWNKLFFPDEDEELRRGGRNQLHLITGRNADGTIRSIRIEGAFSALLQWVGAQDYIEDVHDVLVGDSSIAEKIADVPKAAANKIVQLWDPFTKLTAELMFKKTSYPDVFRPQPIRDRWQHFAGIVAMDRVYARATGKPVPPGSVLSRMMFYRTDPGEAAYHESRSMVAKWKSENRRGGDSGGDPTDRANALYYYKRASQWDDEEAKQYWLQEYAKLGGKSKGLQESVKNAAPLGSLAQKDRRAFLKSLSQSDHAVLDLGQQWYDQVYEGKRAIKRLRVPKLN